MSVFYLSSSLAPGAPLPPLAISGWVYLAIGATLALSPARLLYSRKRRLKWKA